MVYNRFRCVKFEYKVYLDLYFDNSKHLHQICQDDFFPNSGSFSTVPPPRASTSLKVLLKNFDANSMVTLTGRVGGGQGLDFAFQGNIPISS